MNDAAGLALGHLSMSVGISVLAELVGTVLGAVSAAVVYHDLRMTKEGLDEYDILAVFA